ncbi:hypothetical protein K2X05_04890, partial [bacterium]|nr:hypothetical protein [bacterium]
DFEGNLREGFTRCKKNCGTNQFKRKNRYTFQGKALFYESFYNCLLEKTEQLKQNGNCSGGTLGCHDESGHDNHIHLSVPLCPKPRGVVER